MSATTSERIRDGVAANTQRAYSGAADRFTRWCASVGRDPLPASPETLAEYVNHLGTEGKARSTIQQAIAAIRKLHTAAGHKDQPDTELALLVLRSHTREQTKAGRRADQAAPLTLAVMRKMIDTLDPTLLIDVRDHTLLVLAFAMFGRRSEVAAVNVEDITETEHGLTVWIRDAKTDHTEEGQEADLPRGSHPGTDPVTVINRWTGKLADRNITSGPLLRAVDRHSYLGGPLTGEAVHDVIRKLARRADLPHADDYGGHSPRAGAATSALENGASLQAVCRAGRWVDGSAAVGKYWRSVDRWRDHPLRSVGL